MMWICDWVIWVNYEFFGEYGFIKIDLLILIGNVLEGMIDLFYIEYFD